MIRDEIKKLVKKTVKKSFNIELKEVEIEKPKEEKFGDYATNIALVIGKKLGKNPEQVAENLKSSILNLKSDLFEKIEIAGPGFINFFLSKKCLQSGAEEILKQGEKYGNSIKKIDCGSDSFCITSFNWNDCGLQTDLCSR